MPARKRKSTTPAPENPASDAYEPQAPVAVAAAPDVFDEVIANQAAAETAPTPADSAEPAAGPVKPTTLHQPDPHMILTVPLGEGPDSPCIRLFRNHRMKQMAIQFDVPAPEQYRRRVGQEGYKYREKELVWTKQFGDSPTAAQVAGEQLVGEIGNALRAENGLPPVGRAAGR